MKIVFCASNHAPHSQEALRDVTDPVLNGLHAAGIDLFISPVLVPGVCNLLVECFSNQHADELENLDGEFGLICTEWFESGNFNNTVFNGMADRVENFKRVAPRAKFLWPLAPTTEYEKINPNTHALKLTYDENSFIADGDAEPASDFAAFGTMTPERAEQVDTLRRSGFSVVLATEIIPKEARDAMIKSAKYVWGFQPTMSNGMQISPSRVSAALHANRAIINGIDPGLVGLHVLFRGWRDMRDEQLAAFRAGEHMNAQMARLADLSGIR